MTQPVVGIQLINTSTILGLRPSGVEELGNALLDAGLEKQLPTKYPVLNVSTLNHLYDPVRDKETHCLNPETIREFSIGLNKLIADVLQQDRFPFVLGGDCSILIGILPALKAKAEYGLIFMDAHADFYQPEKSTTGEVADMDLAIVTGRGPDILTNIDNLKPYVDDRHVIHIGQRDQEETKKFGSQDILNTAIKCFSFKDIEKMGVEKITFSVLKYIQQLNIEGAWLHFDTDVLHDDINPAVDYRLPGGLQFEQVEYIIGQLLSIQLIKGISVTIYNPALDQDGQIAKNIVKSLGRIFS